MVPSWFAAFKERLYFASFLIPIPLNPSFISSYPLSSFTVTLQKLGLVLFSKTLIVVAIPDSLLKECLSLFGCSQPISGASNSKDLFLIISAYNPPSAAKLISSKKTPYIVGWILAIVFATSTSNVVFWALARTPTSNKLQREIFVIKLFFILVYYFDCFLSS